MPPHRVAQVSSFVGQLSSKETGPRRIFALYCLGEIGAKNDLAQVAALVDSIRSSFLSASEEEKTASRVALLTWRGEACLFHARIV